MNAHKNENEKTKLTLETKLFQKSCIVSNGFYGIHAGLACSDAVLLILSNWYRKSIYMQVNTVFIWLLSMVTNFQDIPFKLHKTWSFLWTFYATHSNRNQHIYSTIFVFHDIFTYQIDTVNTEKKTNEIPFRNGKMLEAIWNLFS